MKREIRASSLAGVAGVGAVVDIGSESFLVPGIERWKEEKLRILQLPRLSSRLRKTLKTPVTDDPFLEVVRFPFSMFCEKCRKMTRWKPDMERADTEPKCPVHGCSGSLVPMRFVAACEDGHLGDVNWWRWAHSGPNGNRDCRRYDALHFRIASTAAGAGLSSLRVECECGSGRSLEDLPNKQIAKATFGPCTGHHPWTPSTHERSPCTADIVILQRGATNLHYPSTISALDIPVQETGTETDQFADQVRSHKNFPRLKSLISSSAGDTAELMDVLLETIADNVGCPESVVREIAVAEAEGRTLGSTSNDSGARPPEQSEILAEEWATFSSALRHGALSTNEFIAESEPLASSAPDWMKSLVRNVLLVRRIREVRAYLGFQRVKPGGPEKTTRPDIGGERPWLPAAEVYGEGFVIELDFPSLERWAVQLPAHEKLSVDRLEERRLTENYWFLPSVDPIFIVVHTLSHLLLRRLAFECGYSSSSLRERLYVDRLAGHAGIMIFTAEGDSEGSLGGLVRQGRRDRLSRTIAEAVDEGSWCSADPVCSETAGQGLGGFNHGACHACSLVAETSCVTANTLLDRRMLYNSEWGLMQFLGADQ